MIFFSKYFASREALKNRIRDLERTVEILTGESNILREELKRAQAKEDDFLQKVFQMSGIKSKTEMVPVERKTTNEIIKLASAKVPWTIARQTLEEDARKQYWLNKKAQQDSQEHAQENEDFLDKINNGELNESTNKVS